MSETAKVLKGRVDRFLSLHNMMPERKTSPNAGFEPGEKQLLRAIFHQAIDDLCGVATAKESEKQCAIRFLMSMAPSIYNDYRKIVEARASAI